MLPATTMLTFTMDNRRVVAEPRDTSRHFEKNTLTHAQVGRIIENCVKMLEDNRDYLYFGVILLVAMGITISELCVLTWRSFSSSNTYTGVTAIEIEAEAKEVMHFGDNYVSDCLAARKANIFADEKITYLPSARDLLTGSCGLTYSGNRFTEMFGSADDPTAPQNYLGNRCIAGVAGNHMFGPGGDSHCGPGK